MKDKKIKLMILCLTQFLAYCRGPNGEAEREKIKKTQMQTEEEIFIIMIQDKRKNGTSKKAESN